MHYKYPIIWMIELYCSPFFLFSQRLLALPRGRIMLYVKDRVPGSAWSQSPSDKGTTLLPLALCQY